MESKTLYRSILEYIGIALGTVIIAISINFFVQPHSFAPGGVTGLGIIIKEATNGLVPVWATNLAIDIPLFIAGLILVGRVFGAKTLYGILFLSFFIWLLPIRAVTDDLLLTAIIGGVLTGVGVGIVFRLGGTTGGTDLAGFMLNKYFPGISISNFMMSIDSLIVIGSGIVTRDIRIPLYSIVTLYISTKAIDLLLNGFSYAKAFFIISEHSDEIGNFILRELDRGVTVLKGKGFYTGRDKDVLLCIVNRSQITTLKEAVHSVDSKAFVMITDANEVLGEGFKELKKS